MSVNLLDLDGEQLAGFVAGLGEKPFRARQLKRWMHRFGESDFARMSDLAKSLREKLARTASVSPPRIVNDSIAGDGTRKWLLDVGKGNAIEAVFIPETNRGTLCISTQAGCTLACRFCSTGRQGFNRNLSVAEIIGQLWLANRELGAIPGGERVISNVVLMGMGEPLLNFDNTVAALKLMLDDDAYGLSRRRVTLSTSGIVPMIDRLRDECPVALAVSLHAPNDALRDRSSSASARCSTAPGSSPRRARRAETRSTPPAGSSRGRFRTVLADRRAWKGEPLESPLARLERARPGRGAFRLRWRAALGRSARRNRQRGDHRRGRRRPGARAHPYRAGGVVLPEGKPRRGSRRSAHRDSRGLELRARLQRARPGVQRLARER